MVLTYSLCSLKFDHSLRGNLIAFNIMAVPSQFTVGFQPYLDRNNMHGTFSSNFPHLSTQPIFSPLLRKKKGCWKCYNLIKNP